MQKRGQLVFIALITIIVAAIVAFSYPYIAKSLATGKTTLKVSAARDMALIIDTVYAYPYDVEIEYDFDLSKFIVEISENNVKIYDASLIELGEEDEIIGRDLFFAQYSFSPVGEEPNFIFDRPKKLIFKKENGKLLVTQQNENTEI